jgi:hypothetical protein
MRVSFLAEFKFCIAHSTQSKFTCALREKSLIDIAVFFHVELVLFSQSKEKDMSKKYIEDNKKASLASRMAPAVISVGSIAAATVITAPGLADSLAFTMGAENDSQIDSAAPQATDLPEAITDQSANPPQTEPVSEATQSTAEASEPMPTEDSPEARVQTLNQTSPTQTSTETSTPTPVPSSSTQPVEAVVAQPEVVLDPITPEPVAVEPVVVEQPAANNSSSTWVGEGSSSSSSVIDQQTPVTSETGNSSSATPYYEDDDDDDDHDDDHDEDYDDDDYEDDDDDDD